MEPIDLDVKIAALAGEPGQEATLAELHNRRGCLRYRSGDLAGAHGDFDAALALRDDYALAYNNRACVRADQGDLARARVDFARALSLQPQLEDARENQHLLAQVAGPEFVGGERTTVSSVRGDTPATFCEGLVQFLEAHVRARPGFEDCREDAIAEVVTRVLAHSQSRDLPLADALREVRKSSTRGWVKSVMGRLGKRGGAPVPPSVEARPTPVGEAPLRLDALFADVQERLLQASRPSKRRRRRIVWGIYLRSLVDGVLLTRREVIVAARELGLGPKRVTDKQIERDLEILVKELRASGPGG